MPLMLGSFTNGLFSSAQSVMSMYGMYQDAQLKQIGLDTAAGVKAAATETAGMERQRALDESPAATSEQGYVTGTSEPDASTASSPGNQPADKDGNGPVDIGKIVGGKERKSVGLPALPVGSPGATPAEAEARASPTSAPATPAPVAPGPTTPNDASGQGRDEYGNPRYPMQALPVTPSYTAANDPARRYQDSATRAQPGTNSDVAAHDQVGAPPPPPPEQYQLNDPDSINRAINVGYPAVAETDRAARTLNQSTDDALSRVGRGPSDQTPTPAAAPGAAPGLTEAGAPAPSSGSSLGSRILSMVNPIGSAQAATPPPTPTPTQGIPVAAPGQPAPDHGSPAATAATAHAVRSATTPATAALAGTDAAPAQTQAGPVTVTPTAKDSGNVAPGQKGPSVQSESSPTVVKHTFDQRPYIALSQQKPQMLAVIDRVANQYGVSPQRLALHGYLESRFNANAPTGKDGEIGAFQIMPATIKMLDPQGRLDPRSFEGSASLAAINIHRLDAEFGADSAGSILGYQSGPGGARAAASNFTLFAATHPVGMTYLHNAYGENSAKLGPGSFTAGGTLTPQGMVEAGAKGPDGVMHYLYTSGPRGMQTTDLWRQAEILMMTEAASRHDYAGMQHARDFVAQMSQQGASGYLMQAHQALSSGNGAGAAQLLARAHAFVPDGSIGRFGVDSSGQVWGQQFSEKDPSQAIGPHFKVTADSLAPLLIQTKDPATYLKMVSEQQKTVASAEYQRAHAQYMKDEIGVQREGHALAAGARVDAANTAAEARRDAATTAADARRDAATIAAGKVREQNTRQVDGETTKAFGSESDLPPTFTPEMRSTGASVMTALRANAHLGGMSPTTAAHVAQNMVTGDYRVGAPDAQGNRPVVDKTNGVKAYITPAMYQKLLTVPGFGKGTSSPVGAGAGTTGALQLGAPTGSLSSSAVPPGAPDPSQTVH